MLNQVFSKYQSTFSDILDKISKEILLHFSSPMDFNAVFSETLAKLLAQLNRKKVGAVKAEKLKAIAFSSCFNFQLRALIEQIPFIKNQVKENEAEISSIMEKPNFPITAITDIGNVTGAAVISETGDITKFDSPRKLAAFAGLDTTVTQSDEFEASHNVMSKHSSLYLRKAIFQAALVASFKAPLLCAYYQKKKSERKTSPDLHWSCFQKDVQYHLCSRKTINLTVQ